jgi:hypothetical protein
MNRILGGRGGPTLKAAFQVRQRSLCPCKSPSLGLLPRNPCLIIECPLSLDVTIDPAPPAAEELLLFMMTDE